MIPFDDDPAFDSAQSIPPRDLEKTLSNGVSVYGSGNERVFLAVTQTLAKNTNKETRQSIIVLTDEGIQDFSGKDMERIILDGERLQIDIYF